MNKKYKFTGKEIHFHKRTLKQIKRISDDLVGGYIESEDNLSHEGDCFVYDDAKVYGNAKVLHNACIYNNALIRHNAMICCRAEVYGNAIIQDNVTVSYAAQVYDHAKICGRSYIGGNASVLDNAIIRDYAKIYGNARVFDNAEVYGHAEVRGRSKICGYDIVTGDVLNILNICQFNITASEKDRYIRVGCKSHTVMEWLSYIYSGEDFYLKLCLNKLEHDKCVKQILNIIETWELQPGGNK